MVSAPANLGSSPISRALMAPVLRTIAFIPISCRWSVVSNAVELSSLDITVLSSELCEHGNKTIGSKMISWSLSARPRRVIALNCGNSSDQ